MSKNWMLQLLTVGAFLGLASTEAMAEQWRIDTTVTRIVTDDANNTFIQFAQELTQGSYGSCTPNRKSYVVIDSATITSAETRKALVSLATTAMLSGRLVTVTESAAACYTLPTSYFGSSQTAYKLKYLELK